VRLLRIVLRFGPGTPLRPFMIFSAVVHVGLAIAVTVIPSFRRTPIVPERSLSVTLVASAALPPAPEPAAAVPAPPPPKPRPVVRPEGVQATPEPKLNPKKPPPEPVEEPEPPPTIEQANPEPGGAVGEAAASVSAATLEGLSSEFTWYVQAVNRALYDAWRQPFLSGQRDPLEVKVSFVILRNGSVRSPQVVESSGIPALDRSTLRAIFEATLPPLPRNFRGETQPALVVFQHFPEDS